MKVLKVLRVRWGGAQTETMEIEGLLEWEGDDEPVWLVRLRKVYLRHRGKIAQRRREQADVR